MIGQIACQSNEGSISVFEGGLTKIFFLMTAKVSLLKLTKMYKWEWDILRASSD